MRTLLVALSLLSLTSKAQEFIVDGFDSTILQGAVLAADGGVVVALEASDRDNDGKQREEKAFVLRKYEPSGRRAWETTSLNHVPVGPVTRSHVSPESSLLALDTGGYVVLVRDPSTFWKEAALAFYDDRGRKTNKQVLEVDLKIKYGKSLERLVIDSVYVAPTEHTLGLKLAISTQERTVGLSGTDTGWAYMETKGKLVHLDLRTMSTDEVLATPGAPDAHFIGPDTEGDSFLSARCLGQFSLYRVSNYTKGARLRSKRDFGKRRGYFVAAAASKTGIVTLCLVDNRYFWSLYEKDSDQPVEERFLAKDVAPQHYRTKVINTSDGGFLFAAPEEGNKSAITLAKLDGEGTLEWKKSITPKKADGATLFPVSLSQSKKGNYLFSATLSREEPQGTTARGWVVLFDEKGEILP